MLLETLKAIVNAGRDALQTTCGLPVRAESVSQPMWSASGGEL